MTISELRHYIVTALENIYDKSEAFNIAILLIEYITGLEKKEQVINPEFLLTSDQTIKLEKMLPRLLQNEPLQYVLEEAWFFGMKFRVNKNVLIPRPETEELVEWMMKVINNQNFKHNNLPKESFGQNSILDIGTGSGCIPIALKKKLPRFNVSAIDISSEAILLAKENALALETDINLMILDFLDEKKWPELGKYDFIVSNPPYIKQKEKEIMHSRVTDHEPHLALFVPEDNALLFYRKLADFASLHLLPGGSLFVEINESLGKEVENLFISKELKNIELRKDMQGKDRMMKCSYY
jgi:release factor glutamine methyltransferase